MDINSVKENPLWFIILSVVIFSVLIILFLIFRPKLFSLNTIENSIQSNNSSIAKPTSDDNRLSIAINALQQRQYSPVQITTQQSIPGGSNFTSQIVSFSVDGLKEYARIDTPTSKKPASGYPVIILNHGYIVPSQYSTVSSYIGVESFFASNGYIVIKPDYRGNGNSEGTHDALQRYNYPVDVMTLLASIKNIPNADSSRIYLWGHSMGGEVTLTVLEVLGKQPELAKNVKAGVLWAPVTDPAKWFGKSNINRLPEAELTPFPYKKTFEILGQPSDSSPIWQSINPLNYLNDIPIPVQLNHGTADPTVPYSWSQELVQKMQQAGRQIQFISYQGADHNMSPDSGQALQNNLQFFNTH